MDSTHTLCDGAVLVSALAFSCHTYLLAEMVLSIDAENITKSSSESAKLSMLEDLPGYRSQHGAHGGTADNTRIRIASLGKGV